jgi:hypothetical protein
MAPGSTQPLTEMSVARTEPDDPCTETRFRLSEKRTSPFESAGVSAQSARRRLSVNLSREATIICIKYVVCFNPCKESGNCDVETYIFIVGSNVG